MRRRAKPAKAEVEAELARVREMLREETSRREGAAERLAEAVEQLTEARAQLTEALERETATGEILRALSTSPYDLQPVLDTLVQAAARFCGAPDVGIFRVEGEQLRMAAGCGVLVDAMVRQPGGLERMVAPLTRGSLAGRAVLERRLVHVHDLAAESEDEFPVGRELQRRLGSRTTAAAPLLRDGGPLGAIMLFRTEVLPFTDRQLGLLQTFAAQAVIAIENVRLFKELEARNRDLTESLEQQTATAEILRVISSSPTDMQPVMDAVAENAARVCGAADALIFHIEGDEQRRVAHFGSLAATTPTVGPVSRASPSGRAILERRTIHIDDILPLLETEYPWVKSAAIAVGARTHLAAPLMREGVPIGAILIRRTVVQPFTDRQIALLQTFAAQAVIAIENVRLFKALEARNRDLAEALEQQTATAEVLRVIAAAQTDAQPVFDAIAAHALRLCSASNCAVFRFDGELIHVVALENVNPEGTESVRRAYPTPPSRGNATARAIASRDVVYLPDVREDPEYQLQGMAAAVRFRSALAVPMIRDGNPIGAISVTGADVAAFSDNQVELLKTFADQAVIAIENARLFNELRERTAELTRSVGQLTALGEVGHAVSSTLELDTVLSTIVERAVQLSVTDGGIIYEFDEAAQIFRVRTASRQTEPEHLEALAATPLRLGEGALGRAAVTGGSVEVEDIRADGAPVAPQVRHILTRLGYRSLLAVPLLREGRILGGLVVWRRESGRFSGDVVSLLQTFATQSALAIQNARLFREIEDKSRELEAASRHKSEFLANMSHELRTPLNAIIGFSEVLTERMFGDLNEKQDEYLKDIHVSGQHLLSLINDILDLSKIEAGRMELELTHFDLSQAIGNALTLVRERAGRRSIALHQAMDERLGQIRGDERKIKQVLLNLLSNALKFTPEGGRVDVRASIVDGVAEISVADTGVGIAPEDQAAVFEEFRQVGTAAKKVEGTGLGLTLSRKFIELHGGRIWVESQEGIGSTFTFTLPLTRHSEITPTR